ncbi:MAG: hypothetical protein AB1635_06415 [Acidobacteriota bacterium]
MMSSRLSIGRLSGALALAGLLAFSGTAAPLVAQQLPAGALRASGDGVTPAFEGWFENADGSFTLLVGYFNRNTSEAVEIPIGPNNRIEPGGPDMGQPTYFPGRRGWGVFTIRVPKDFGDKRYTWTITANGQTNAISFGLIKDYQVEPYADAAMGNKPPTVKFAMDGKTYTGPPVVGEFGATLIGTVGQPVAITYWVADDLHEEEGPSLRRGPPITTTIVKHRGPGEVKLENARPLADLKDNGKVSTTATFSAPGEYILRVQVNDSTGDGGGGFQCCWTNAYLKVTIK